MSRVELETTIHEVEAVVNSRPLTFVSDEVDGNDPLTPAHFLLGHSGGFCSPGIPPSPVISSQDLTDRYELRKSLLDRFWSVWTSDYIRNLPPFKGSNGSSNLKIGSLVMVQDDQCPLLKWPLGVVTQLFPSKDGVIRTVEIKTATSTLIRSVPRVHDLELVTGSSSDLISRVSQSGVSTPSLQKMCDHSDKGNVNVPVTDNDCDNVVPLITRSGRRVKPVTKMNL